MRLRTRYYSRFHEAVMIFIVCVCILSSIFSYQKINDLPSGVVYNFLPSTSIFELMAFLFSLSLISRVNKKILLFQAVSFIVILYGLLSFLCFENKGGWFDFLIIYKPFFYALMASFFLGKQLHDLEYCRFLFKLLSLFFFIKYVVSICFFDIERPGLFTENNFEIMFLSLLFLSTYKTGGIFVKFDYAILFFIAFISGSRSGILSVFLIFFPLFFFEGRQGQKKKRSRVLLLLVFIVVSVAVVLVFSSRMGSGGVESIDRYKFLLVFIDEMQHSGLSVWLFGHQPITPISYSNAESLQSYKNLFSDYEHRVAFSVLFHSFYLRMVFDHGVVGLLFIILFIARCLKVSGIPLNVFCGAFLVLLTNGLSVSSLYSVYSFLGIYFLLTRFENDSLPGLSRESFSKK